MTLSENEVLRRLDLKKM